MHLHKHFFIVTITIELALCADYCKSSLNIIDVSSIYGNQSTSCISSGKNLVRCSDIWSAMNYKQLNNTCIRLMNNQTLTNRIQSAYIHQLRITKHPNITTSIKVTCKNSNNNVGFGFVNSSNLFISSIQFDHCGMRQCSTSTPPENQATIPYITTAFYFKNILNIEMINVYFTRSHGYAITMYDVSRSLFFEKVYVAGGLMVPYIYQNKTIHGFSSGGGIYLEHTSNAVPIYASKSLVRFQSCSFYANKADNHSAGPSVKGLEGRHQPFGRGGGIAVFFLGNTKNIKVYVIDCWFAYNTATWGGGAYIQFKHGASTNEVYFHSVHILFNKATLSGGGCFIINMQTSSDYRNTVSLLHSQFLNNTAEVGGGFCQRHFGNEVIYKEKTVMYNCSFYGNQAKLGSAIKLQHTNIVFQYLKMTENDVCSKFSVIYTGLGALYAFESILEFHGNNLVNRNNNTAFVLDCSDIYVMENLTFVANMGGNGGALSLYGHSKLFLSNVAHLNLFDNSAIHRGGAVYASIPRPPMIPEMIAQLRIYECFFQFPGLSQFELPNKFTGSVEFHNNNAAEQGNDIFTTTLQNCCKSNQALTEVFTGWRNFKFTSNNSISTDPAKVNIVRSEWGKNWPGRLFSPHIYLTDERNNNVGGTVDIEIVPFDSSSNIQIETNKRFVVKKNNLITLKLIGDQFKKFNIRISLVASSSIFKDIDSLHLDPCYFGYTFIKDQCKCSIKKNQAKGISLCYDNQIYLFKDRWANPKQAAIKHDNEITHLCPDSYCRMCDERYKGFGCLFNPNNASQCVSGRNQTSYLCSQCQTGQSVLFGSENCRGCSGREGYNYLWIIPVLVLVISIVVLFVLVLDVDIYSSYLNGCLYYYQIVELLLTSHLEIYGPLNVIIGVINMESTGGFSDICLWNGMDNLQKNAFNYIIPVWMMIFLVLVSVYSKYRTNSYFTKQKCSRAFTVISVFAYSDFTRITFMLLEGVKVDGKVHVWIYAKLKYGEGQHLPYLIFASIFITFIVIGCPVMLMASSWLTGLDCRYFINPTARWHPVFNSFKYCFRFNRQWFASFYFLCRALFFAIVGFVPRGPSLNAALVLLCLVICIFFEIMLPYKTIWMNMFDLMVLANLTAIAILSLAMRSVLSVNERLNFGFVINVLMYIPLTLVSIRLISVYFSKLCNFCAKKFSRKKQERRLKRRLLVDIATQSLLSSESTDDDEDNLAIHAWLSAGDNPDNEHDSANMTSIT